MALRVWSLICLVVGGVTLVGFLVAVFTPAATVVARRLAVAPDVGTADAIVVLGASADRDGTLSDSSLRRAVAGITLYRDGLAPRLVFLGMMAEAEARARLAVALGVPSAAIRTEGIAPTTRAEAAWMAVVLAQRLGVHRVLLVTDAVHMRRAHGLFTRAGFVVRPAPTALFGFHASSPGGRLRLTQYVAQELAALAYHKLFEYL
jgi:uncharacterized SAM-binding protein YcdF (DUF218 family)